MSVCHSCETCARAGGVAGIHGYRHSRGACARAGGVAGIHGYRHSCETCARAGGVAGIHGYRHSRGSGNPVIRHNYSLPPIIENLQEIMLA
ncbi:MAG: hypothetical protein GQ536_05260 [Candidatus Aminicenantes bacterium]|nr:hypothetical protein [Candidatus Aminicenantes bacterium]